MSPESGSTQRIDRDVFLKRAQNESQCLGHSIIGDEHLLLALCCEYALEVVQLFSDFGLSASRIRREIFLRLGRIDLVTQGKLMTWECIDSNIDVINTVSNPDLTDEWKFPGPGHNNGTNLSAI